MSRVVRAEESNTGLVFEIGPPQQKCYRKPNLQSTAIPAVVNCVLVSVPKACGFFFKSTLRLFRNGNGNHGRFDSGT